MRIAVIGAGFCGLSLALKLLEGGAQVTIFDGSGIGGGASGVASGLMHPYPGETCKRSFRAEEGMAATQELLDQIQQELGYCVASYDGIIRYIQTDAQKETLLAHCETYGDLEQRDAESFWIRSGVTIHSVLYLQALWALIEKRRGSFENVQVKNVSELEGYDSIVIAAGAGIAAFPECALLKYQLTKGQILTAKGPKLLESSVIGKGYVAVGQEAGLYFIGSTYEREYLSEESDLELTQLSVLPKIRTFFPEVDQLEIKGCRAGVRVSRIGHYYPMIGQLSETCWVFTGMGSRGLLYHAYLAKYITRAILSQDRSSIWTENFSF